MSDVFTFEEGATPLLVSVPHDGRNIPDDMARQMTQAGRSIPDTDWHVARLYRFVRDMGASMICAEYSRYVVDLNRSADDEELYSGRFGTGLCPTETFSGDPIYDDGTKVDIASRVATYWQPYHNKIDSTLRRLRREHGFALLWDAHSIPSRVPKLFIGELPQLNLGTWDNRSCDVSISDKVSAIADTSYYSSAVNGRFKGGYITRHYGRPADGIHAMQLEVAQRCYMDESSLAYDEGKARVLQQTIRRFLEVFLTLGK